MPQRPGRVPKAPKLAKALFNCPRTGRLQVLPAQTPQPALVLVGNVLPPVQPKILRAGQPLILRALKFPMFFLTDLVHCLDNVRHKMITVEDDLLLDLGKIIPNRGQIRIPDVHGDSLDLLSFLLRGTAKIAVQAFLLPVVSDIVHRRSVHIVGQSDVVVPFAHRLLIHADRLGYPFLFPLQPPRNGLFHDMPGFIPADPQDEGSALHIADVKETSIASRSNNAVNRSFSSAQGNSTCRTP